MELLDVLGEASLVHAPVGPDVPSVAVLLIVVVGADVDVPVDLGRLPAALPVPHSLVELPLVARTVGPQVLALPMELAVLVFPFVLVPVDEHLHSERLLYRLYERPIVILLL